MKHTDAVGQDQLRILTDEVRLSEEIQDVQRLPAPVTVGVAQLHPVTREFATIWIVEQAVQRSQQVVLTANVDHFVQLERNATFRKAYADANLAVADGKPVYWLSKLGKTPVPERIAGIDLFSDVCAQGNVEGLRIFLLGGTEARSAAAAKNLQGEYPGLIIVGRYTGNVSSDAASKPLIDLIAQANPNLVAVCLGAPKQEIWVNQNINELPNAVYMCLGATIDFWSGEVRRAPMWMQTAGLEWVHRMLSDPRRLIKRYLINDLRFLLILARASRRLVQRKIKA